MTKTIRTLLQTFVLVSLSLSLNFLASCGSKNQEARIEDTEGGIELLEREFGECDDGSTDDNIPQYVRRSSDFERTDRNLPHSYPSLGEMYPSRGTFRQTKAEIMDVVDRYIWSQERGTTKLLEYFDMVLLVNVSPRDSSDSTDSSAQRMQVYVRNGSSNELADWNRIHVWPISSGVPCGKKIATYTGVFKINPSRVYSRYYSELFDNADMYETMFLYHNYLDGSPTGVAIHGTYATTGLGRRDSGGCVRLYRENSKCLYDTIKGNLTTKCLAGGNLNYMGRVPSFLARFGEADPDYLSDGSLEVNGIKVLIAIFNERNDKI